MKLTKQGIITEVRTDGLACVRFGTGLCDVEWVRSRGHKVGEKVILMYVRSVSFATWEIAGTPERKAA